MQKLSNKKFAEYLEKKVRNTIRKYELFTKKDKIGVALSGGKDSITCLFILNKLGYNIKAITLDPNIGKYTDETVKVAQDFCKKQQIPLNIYSFREEFGSGLCFITNKLKQNKINHPSCRTCGILKRYLLNKYAKELKFTVLATGHNLDDEAQAFLMNVLRSDIKLATRQGPISGNIKTKSFVKRVKPLYLIREEEVIRYSKIRNFPVKYEVCPCSTRAYRREYKNFLDKFEIKHPDVKYNIVKFHEKMIDLVPKSKLTKGKINKCTICNEPSANEICSTCEIMKLIKK